MSARSHSVVLVVEDPLWILCNHCANYRRSAVSSRCRCTDQGLRPHQQKHNVLQRQYLRLLSSGVQQGCVLASTLFGIFFPMLLQYAFKGCIEGVYLHTYANGKLFNIARLHSKTKVPSSMKCYSLTMQLWQPSPKLSSNSSWAACLMPASSSG